MVLASRRCDAATPRSATGGSEAPAHRRRNVPYAVCGGLARAPSVTALAELVGRHAVRRFGMRRMWPSAGDSLARQPTSLVSLLGCPRSKNLRMNALRPQKCESTHWVNGVSVRRPHRVAASATASRYSRSRARSAAG